VRALCRNGILTRCDDVLRGWSCDSDFLLVYFVCRLRWYCDVEVNGNAARLGWRRQG